MQRSQLLELLVVAGNVWLAVVRYGTDTPRFSKQGHPHPVPHGSRQLPVVLQLVLEPGQLCHDMLALITLRRGVDRGDRSMDVVDDSGLRLLFSDCDFVALGEVIKYQYDGPSLTGGLIGKRGALRGAVGCCEWVSHMLEGSRVAGALAHGAWNVTPSVRVGSQRRLNLINKVSLMAARSKIACGKSEVRNSD